jgi:uncharacterized protein GlcG (DUF336 family)
MSALPLASAQTIIDHALGHARANQFKPLAVVVLDARGALVAAVTEDGSALGRWQVAFAKASGAVFMGSGSRRLASMASERPHFIGAVGRLPAGGLVPGGVLVRDGRGEIVGAVGVSGDTSDNDEAAAAAGVASAGFTADAG